MSNRIINYDSNNFTMPLHFLWGAFKSQNSSIPYFMSTLSYKEVKNYIDLFEDLHKTGYNWEIGELIQRQIDWNRVKDKILPYLTGKNPVFFNGITVVLIPKNGSSLSVDFNKEYDKIILERDGSNILKAGPIEFKFFNERSSGVPEVGSNEFLYGHFAWDMNEVLAVAIDGQHRVASIKELVDASGRADNDDKLKSRVPFMFLLFDDLVGYIPSGTFKGLEIVRRVFLDLNSHAVHVARTRQILLDDYQIRSILVKNLLTKNMTNDLSSISSDDPRIPLSLVDWHTDNTKIDRNPYLTTVTLLDLIVETLVGIKTNIVSTDYNALELLLKNLGKNLNLTDELIEAKNRLYLATENDKLFELSDDEREIIEKAFSSSLKKVIVYILTEFKPYKDFCDFRMNKNSLSLEWQTWYPLQIAATQKSDSKSSDLLKKYENELQKDQNINFSPSLYQSIETKILSNKGSNSSLPFKTVFQKVLFKSFFNFNRKYSSTDSVKIGNFLSNDEGEELDFSVINNSENFSDKVNTISKNMFNFNDELLSKAELYVSLINKLYLKVNQIFEYDYSFKIIDNYNDGVERNIFLWHGSFYNKDNNTIDHNAGAADRASDLFLLILLFSLMKEINNNANFDAIWSEVTSTTLNSSNPELVNYMREIVFRLSKINVPSLVTRIFTNIGVDEPSIERAKDEIKVRVFNVWKKI